MFLLFFLKNFTFIFVFILPFCDYFILINYLRLVVPVSQWNWLWDCHIEVGWERRLSFNESVLTRVCGVLMFLIMHNLYEFSIF